MEDAYRRMSDPNANYVDKLRAEEEMGEAVQIRNSVLPSLSEDQQKALREINSTEQAGILDAGNADFGQTGAEAHARGREEFQRGMQENQSLINWISET
jgi:hypothetical protein